MKVIEDVTTIVVQMTETLADIAETEARKEGGIIEGSSIQNQRCHIMKIPDQDQEVGKREEPEEKRQKAVLDLERAPKPKPVNLHLVLFLLKCHKAYRKQVQITFLNKGMSK